MDARQGTGEEQAPESQSELISLARGVPGLSETALLAFNLLLDTTSRSSEQGGFQSQASLCVFLRVFLLPPGVWAIISLEQSWRIFCFSSRVPPCCTNTLVGN